MKKTLHGKRHIRARKSVAIGRDRKRVKKFYKGMKILMLNIQSLKHQIVNCFSIFGDIFKRADAGIYSALSNLGYQILEGGLEDGSSNCKN